MPFRPYPTDQPDRETTWRRGRVRARMAAANQANGYAYIVDFEPFGTETVFGIQSYAINAIVHCIWRNESGTWWIAL